MSTNKTCPVTGGWCWKNPVQTVLLLAALPYAVKTVAWLWAAVAHAAGCAAK
jgi:hypothetical protein